MIRTVQVKPKDYAIIKCIYCEKDGDTEKHKITMEGDDYKLWGENDDYLGQFCINKITGGTETIIGTDFVAPTKLNITDNIPTPITNDNRSIHNEADVAKIQTLQEQLEEQQKKLKTITDLLINKGLV